LILKALWKIDIKDNSLENLFKTGSVRNRIERYTGARDNNFANPQALRFAQYNTILRTSLAKCPSFGASIHISTILDRAF
jgi:hypothetical protein